jgi:hypothetical protein
VSGLLDAVDALYRGCSMEPGRWNEQAFVDWSEAVAVDTPIDKELARHVRRCLMAGRRLAAFWVDRESDGVPEDWRARVDIALGVRAWRPQLDLAFALLARSGDESTFERVGALFPVVNNLPFLDGIDYETWRQDRLDGSSGGSIAP